MQEKSLNVTWGEELRQLGYSKKTVNHFEKKYKNNWLCIDYDLMGFILMFRLLKLNNLNKTFCMQNIKIENMSSLTQIEFISLVSKIETQFKEFIDKNK